MDRTKTDLKKFHFIYRTTNLLNGRYYVGLHSTNNVDDAYIGSGKRFWNEVNKYGRENFKREILEYLPTRQELKARERSLVNEDMLNDPLCMNLKLGGEGGWDHVKNQAEISPLGNAAFKKKLVENHEFAAKFAQKSGERMKLLHRAGKIRYDTFSGQKHTQETKAQISASMKQKQTGEANSQFGTCWVCNEVGPIKIKKDELDNYLASGYRRGRK